MKKSVKGVSTYCSFLITQLPVIVLLVLINCSGLNPFPTVPQLADTVTSTCVPTAAVLGFSAFPEVSVIATV